MVSHGCLGGATASYLEKSACLEKREFNRISSFLEVAEIACQSKGCLPGVEKDNSMTRTERERTC